MKILLATDGSDSARSALDFVVRLPFPRDSELRLITVLQPVLEDAEMSELSEAHHELFEKARQNEQDTAAQLLEEEARRIDEAGWKGTTEIRTGNPAEQIVAAAESAAADLVVVGSHGHKGVKQYLLGSVSDRVLRHASCSVLVVRHPPAREDGSIPLLGAEKPRRLLVAFDGSAPAQKAVELCASLPVAAGSEVQALTVLPLIKMYRQDIRQHLSWVWQEKVEAAKQGLDWVSKQVDWSNAEVSTRLEESPDVAQAILDASATQGSDLIVLGHKGRGAVEQFLMGSVTKKVSHQAPCSVLTVRD
jgi:nucleotide-binding universal stress UspA family protein